MDKHIPKQFQNIFKDWEEYSNWANEKSKKELLKAFDEYEK